MRQTGAPETPRDLPPATNRAFAAALELQHLSQRAAASILGLETGTVSAYVSGQKRLFPDNYRRKCAQLGMTPTAAEQLLALAEEAGGELTAAESAGRIGDEIGRLAEQLAASSADEIRRAVEEEDRRDLQALWKGLQKLPLTGWRLAVAAAPRELQRWAFVKLVSEESEQVASVDGKQALELAGFALWVAERISGEESWASRVFAWAILGNARRVGSDLTGAEEAFAQSARLQAERPEGQLDLPEPWRLLDLEASLRIDLRQVPAALRLLDRAAGVAPPVGPIQARLLCKRANALYRIGDLQGSIETLRQGLAHIDHEAERRLFFMLQSNLAERLTEIGQPAEAAEMFAELRRLKSHVGNGLNQIRLRWLEGKIDAGLGRLDPAIETLSWVRAAFAQEEAHYDEAQAGMELAELYLKKGRTADVKRLVRLMEPVFRAQGVPEEAQKALALFRRAVAVESVTPDLAGRVAAFLRRVQHDPELRFQEAA
jgi:tetratricopeptide (TPR) repeat protein